MGEYTNMDALIPELDLPVAAAGVGYPGLNVHAPNENKRLNLFLLGAIYFVRILMEFGKT